MPRAGLCLVRGHVVAPFRLFVEHALNGERPTAVKSGKFLTQFVGENPRDQCTVPSVEDQRLGPVGRHCVVPGGKIETDSLAPYR